MLTNRGGGGGGCYNPYEGLLVEGGTSHIQNLEGVQGVPRLLPKPLGNAPELPGPSPRP